MSKPASCIIPSAASPPASIADPNASSGVAPFARASLKLSWAAFIPASSISGGMPKSVAAVSTALPAASPASCGEAPFAIASLKASIPIVLKSGISSPKASEPASMPAFIAPSIHSPGGIPASIFA